MLVAHRGEQLHVLVHLVVILGMRSSELEVDDDPLVAIGHHAIRAALVQLTVFDRENGALIEECPTV